MAAVGKMSEDGIEGVVIFPGGAIFYGKRFRERGDGAENGRDDLVEFGDEGAAALPDVEASVGELFVVDGNEIVALVFEGGVAHFEDFAVIAKGIDEKGIKKAHNLVKKPAAPVGGPADERNVVVTEHDGGDVADELFAVVKALAVEVDAFFRGGKFESDGAGEVVLLRAEVGAVEGHFFFAESDEFTVGFGAKTAAVGEEVDRLKKVAFALTIFAYQEDTGGVEADLLVFQISVGVGSDGLESHLALCSPLHKLGESLWLQVRVQDYLQKPDRSGSGFSVKLHRHDYMKIFMLRL